ncbi:ribonuclease kappa-B-like [Saccoglossus kowalevskii]|uniref:Ribonuclease kappa-B-like n=1 Tax=Saccoglossus kowalevskii TaxID=10224 RepID=A0ABM0GMQ4_SACKO|nr:PREDICTED: ribonuclease kappa-B-like [Saccoglossus kowalevskii]
MPILVPGICGPRASICCLLTSIWGITLLVIVGILLRFDAVAFLEDLPLPEADDYNQESVHEVYVAASNNCFIAAGLYVLCMVFSFWQKWEYSRVPFRMN